MSFETAVARLEEVVRELETEGLPLDRALALFEEGIARLREASQELSRAEAAVTVLKERTEGVLEETEFRA